MKSSEIAQSLNVNRHEIQMWTGQAYMFCVFCISFLSWSISTVSCILQKRVQCVWLVSIAALFSLNPVWASWQLICHSVAESLLLLSSLHPGKATFQPSTLVTHSTCTAAVEPLPTVIKFYIGFWVYFSLHSVSLCSIFNKLTVLYVEKKIILWNTSPF